MSSVEFNGEAVPVVGCVNAETEYVVFHGDKEADVCEVCGEDITEYL
jgi:hypothetical protein